MTVVLGAALALALVIVGIALFQHRLLYFPGHASLADIARGGLSAWPDANDFRGLAAQPRTEEPHGLRGTAIVFHGNAGHAGHRSFYAQALTPLGLRVILAEYPGYGPRDGDLGEASLVADAERTIRLAHRLHGEPLLVIGESLGAAVAAAAAARQEGIVAGLLLITPWDRLEHVASHHYPWLPVRWLLGDRYDSIDDLSAFRRPVVIVLAENDEIVPARFGRALHERLGRTSKLLTVPTAGHNDWPARVDATWWRDTIAALLPVPPGTPR